MSLPFILFFACALLAVAGGMLLILSREPIHSALSLILVMMSLAVLYLLLGAEFIAAVQIIVYAGAIMVLVRLCHHAVERRGRRTHEFQPASPKFVGVPLGFFLLLVIAHLAVRVHPQARSIANGPGGRVERGVPPAHLSTAAFPAVSFSV